VIRRRSVPLPRYREAAGEGRSSDEAALSGRANPPSGDPTRDLAPAMAIGSNRLRSTTKSAQIDVISSATIARHSQEELVFRPVWPRRRNLSSLRIRFRCPSSLSTFLLSRHETTSARSPSSPRLNATHTAAPAARSPMTTPAARFRRAIPEKRLDNWRGGPSAGSAPRRRASGACPSSASKEAASRAPVCRTSS
jgi:hypothetical protein